MSTYKQTVVNGLPISVANEVVQLEGFYISYNDYDLDIYGCDTTAIVVEDPTNFLILNGDHRENLKGMNREEACAYFHANPDKHNKISDPHEDHKFIFKKQK